MIFSISQIQTIENSSWWGYGLAKGKQCEMDCVLRLEIWVN